MTSRRSNGLPEKHSEFRGISEYTLENGLRVLIFPDPTKATITLNMTYLVGSRHESRGQRGCAHLLEHMLFKRTRRHADICREMGEHGARVNGSTWADRTNFFETSAAEEAHLNWALDLEADRMVGAMITARELDRERRVVLDELEMGENQPLTVLTHRVMATAFQGHGYGHPSVGVKSDIMELKAREVRTFYRQHYRPDNAVLVVAGKLDPKVCLEKVHQAFSPIPRPRKRIHVSRHAIPTQDGPREIRLHRPGELPLIAAGYHLPPGDHACFPALNILTQILAGSSWSWLHRKLVDPGLASQVWGFNLQWRDGGLALFGLRVHQGVPAETVRHRFVRALEKIKGKITIDQLERARNRLLRNSQLAFNSSQTIALQLSEWIGLGDWRLMFANQEALERVKLQDVRTVADAFLQTANRSLGLFLPSKERQDVKIPQGPRLTVQHDAPDTEWQHGAAFDASPQSIQERTHIHAPPSGLRMAVLPKQTRGKSAWLAMRIHFGDENSLQNQSSAANLCAGMLMRGTLTRSRDAVEAELDRMRVRLHLGGSAEGVGLSLEGGRESLLPALILVADLLQHPSFPANELELLKAETKAGLEQARQSPQAQIMRLAQRHFTPVAPAHPRHVFTLDQEIAKTQQIQREDLIHFHQTFFGISCAEVAVVGDMDVAHVQTSMENWHHWPANTPFHRISLAHTAIPPVHHHVHTPDKDSAAFSAILAFPMRDDHDDAVALTLANTILGGGFLDSRLTVRLRQKEGMSYSVQSQLQIPALDNRSHFAIMASCAPSSLPLLKQAVLEEIHRALENGFQQDELDRARRGLLEQRRMAYTQDAHLAVKWRDYLFLGRDFNWDIQWEQALRQLTPETVHRALKTHVNPDQLSFFTASRNPEF